MWVHIAGIISPEFDGIWNFVSQQYRLIMIARMRMAVNLKVNTLEHLEMVVHFRFSNKSTTTIGVV